MTDKIRIPPETNNDPPAQADSPILLRQEAIPIQRLTGWKRIRFLLKVVEIRLRFVLVLAATFVVIGKWDTIKNFWEKWTRPATVEVKKLSDTEYFCPMHPSVVRDGLESDGSVPKCPICGMPLSLHKKGEHVELPEGIAARVQLSPERIQMAGLKTARSPIGRWSEGDSHGRLRRLRRVATLADCQPGGRIRRKTLCR